MKFKSSTLLALSFVISGSLSPAYADNSDFYNGKTIELLIGYSPGGGYDTYARTLARHIPEHIPGNPEIVVKNVPGAGSLVLMNQLANTLSEDGTVFATIGRGLAFEPLFGNEKARFDPIKLNWLGSLNSETGLNVAWHESDVQSWEDLRTKTLTVGGTGSGSDSNVFPRVFSEVLGFKFNVISGYPGLNDILLATERGEVEGPGSWSYSSAKAKHPNWIKEDGKVNILFQTALKKHPDLPNVPLVIDLAETEKQRNVLKLLLARQTMGRPFVAPAGVPSDRVAILRKAMEATAKDPDFIDEAEKKGLGVVFVSGEEIQDIVTEAYQYPDDVVEVIKSAM